MFEKWKIIKNFPDYAVSNQGKIKRIINDKWNHKCKILKNCVDSKGYEYVYLYKNGKRKIKRIHTLVYETFNNYTLKEDECIHHINENKKDNVFNNLEKKDKSRHNSDHCKGKNNPFYGKQHSVESKIKISKKRIGNHYEKLSKRIKEKYKNGELNVKGENSPTHKLKNGEVWLIKKILNSDYYKFGKITNILIGKMFEVSTATISMIKTNKRWSHINYE